MRHSHSVEKGCDMISHGLKLIRDQVAVSALVIFQAISLMTATLPWRFVTPLGSPTRG